MKRRRLWCASFLLALVVSEGHAQEGAQARVPTAVRAFVARERADTTDGVRVVAYLAGGRVTLFEVGSLNGVVIRGQPIGWLGVPAVDSQSGELDSVSAARHWFELVPSDSTVTATAAVPAGPVSGARLAWRQQVAASGVTPLATLLALVEADSSMIPLVAANPRLLRADESPAQVAAIGAVDRRLTVIVLANPALADSQMARLHAAVLLRLERQQPSALPTVAGRVAAMAPDLARGGLLSERELVAVIEATFAAHDDKHAKAFVGLPDVRGSDLALLALALGATPDSSIRRAADSVLGDRGVTEGDIVRPLIARLPADTAGELAVSMTLGFELLHWALVAHDMPLAGEIAHLDPTAGNRRHQMLQMTASQMLATSADTPREVLLQMVHDVVGRAQADQHASSPQLAIALQQTDSRILEFLIRNQRVMNDREILQTLAQLPDTPGGMNRFYQYQRLAAHRLAHLDAANPQ
jgi:hypothetical protein